MDGNNFDFPALNDEETASVTTINYDSFGEKDVL